MIFASLDFYLGLIFGNIVAGAFLVWYGNKLIKMGLMTLSFPILEQRLKALFQKAKGEDKNGKKNDSN